MNHVDNKKGFTLIELMLAMAFVSVLLIAITMTVIQIGNIYTRGLTIKEVNQAGGALATELQRDINASTPFDITAGGSNYIVSEWGGRLCIGQYSYIWNYGKALNNNDSSHLNIYDSTSSEKIRFIKVLDSGADYCSKASSTKKVIDPSDAVELLSVSEHDLAIHEFTISSNLTARDTKTGQQIYNIEFIVGTNDISALNYVGAATCKTPDDVKSDLSYCLVNQFNIVSRAGNAVE